MYGNVFKIEGSLAMLIATDPFSLVFIACFLFGLLFFLVTALLGNISGHGHMGVHSAPHHMGIHIGGHAHAPAVGAAHAAPGTHVVAHSGTSTPGQTASAQQSGNSSAQVDLL